MRYLSSALYPEGPTDALFLPPLLRRLCEHLAAQAVGPVEIPDVLVLDDAHEHRGLDRATRIESAARASSSAWVVLFIHADADDRDPRFARAERVQPAVGQLAPMLGNVRQAVAVVPVRMTEAWILADPDAFRTAVGTRLSDKALGLDNVLAHGTDHAADPKALLERAFVAARPRARQAQSAGDVVRIGECASLLRLRQLEAFQQLEADLMAALRALRILQ